MGGSVDSGGEKIHNNKRNLQERERASAAAVARNEKNWMPSKVKYWQCWEHRLSHCYMCVFHRNDDREKNENR